MPYGTIKIDTITFTNGGVDKSVPVSGLVQNPTFTGNVTVTGTISGNIIQGGTTVSGVTITGTTVSTTTGNFTSLTGTTATITSGIIASGTAALPSLAILSDPNTGIYSPGADQLAVATNGTGRLFVQADGDVCIGQSTGDSQLVVKGSTAARTVSQFIANDTSTTTMSVWERSDGAVSSRLIYDGTGLIKFGTSTAHALTLDTSNTERLRITSAGLVGIGTTSPGFALDVHSGSAGSIINLNTTRLGGGGFAIANNGSARLYLGSANWMGISGEGTGTTSVSLASAENSAIIFATNAAYSVAERMRITSGGNVGIGTTLPTAKLQISNTSAGAATIGLFLVNESRDINTEIRLAFAANTNNDIASNRYSYISTLNTTGDSNGQSMIFATNENGGVASERMRITSGGNVGIGTTSPASPLDVNGRVRSNAFFTKFEATSNATTNIPTGTQSGGYTYTALDNQAGSNSASFIRLGGVVAGLNQSGAWIGAHYNMNFSSDVQIYSGKQGNNTLANYDSALNAIFSQDIITFHTGAIGTGNTSQRLALTTSYLRMASGTGGIQFNGDTAAANALDDYEEGTWTPAGITGAGGATVQLSVAKYTKIGNKVTLFWRFEGGGTTGTQTIANITGLPFAMGSGASLSHGTGLFAWSGGNAPAAYILSAGGSGAVPTTAQTIGTVTTITGAGYSFNFIFTYFV